MKRTALLRKSPMNRISPKRAGVASITASARLLPPRKQLRAVAIKPSGKRMKQGRSTEKPSMEEAMRFEHIKAIGCLACLMGGLRPPTPEVHHLTQTGRHGHKRRGHRYTIGICRWHHRGVPPAGMNERQALAARGPSYQLQAKAFRERYGNDDSLLALQDQLIELRVIACN